MKNVCGPNPSKAPTFATTRWSVVKSCRSSDEYQAQAALAELCQTYWRPVYACIRHRGYSVHDAQDLTQTFFVQLLRGQYFEHLDQSKGRFRAYLSVALQNFLRDRWRRWTWRRGRGTVVFSLEADEAEGAYEEALDRSATAEMLYERQWARTVIDQALQQLAVELAADKKTELFGYFDALLTGAAQDFRHAEIAQALNVSVGALHTALHRWRRRLQILLREEVGRTLLSKTEIDDELRHLLNAFAGKS